VPGNCGASGRDGSRQSWMRGRGKRGHGQRVE
jgi:hypothetical protein